MEGLKFQTLEILVEPGKPTRIKWLGSSQARDPGSTITPYFEKLADELEGSRVIVDFTELNYMNSSSVLPIVGMCKLFDKKAINTIIRYNSDLGWQTASFKVLVTLSRTMPHITVEPCSGV